MTKRLSVVASLEVWGGYLILFLTAVAASRPTPWEWWSGALATGLILGFVLLGHGIVMADKAKHPDDHDRLPWIGFGVMVLGPSVVLAQFLGFLPHS